MGPAPHSVSASGRVSEDPASPLAGSLSAEAGPRHLLESRERHEHCLERAAEARSCGVLRVPGAQGAGAHREACLAGADLLWNSPPPTVQLPMNISWRPWMTFQIEPDIRVWD